MATDFEKILPQSLHGRKGKWKFGLLLVFFELVVLGLLGGSIYRWFAG
ncbi:hypothetical protein [Geopsychrobacter electrodiphilus]|nr:hypothetical protein [Geopsychrobacter electrodiphilus]